jgi:hypothetical protein
MATKFRTHVPILAAIAGLFVTPICCSAEERTPSADDAVHATAKKDGEQLRWMQCSMSLRRSGRLGTC